MTWLDIVFVWAALVVLIAGVVCDGSMLVRRARARRRGEAPAVLFKPGGDDHGLN